MTEFSGILTDLHIEFELNYSLSKASSFRVGGNADIAIFPRDEDEFALIIFEAQKRNIKFEVIGNGSNVLFSDDGYKGAIIFTKNISEMVCNCNQITAFCGAKLPSLANLARNNSLSGLEFAHGIPGSVGGAVAMNAGAFGGAMSDVLITSRALDINTRKIITIDKNEHRFDYRKSIYSENKNLICISAAFVLKDGDVFEINEKMQENVRTRRLKQPVELPSCGSFFKRPEGYFAGKLIEDCNLKGVSVGGAMVSQKHAGFIVNTGGATSSDIVSLAKLIEDTVFEKFGVKLEREVKYIF